MILFCQLNFLLLILGRLIIAHSWVEQLTHIAPNSSYYGEYGYPRSFVDKGVAGFNQNANLWLIPPIERQPPRIRESDYICHPDQRTRLNSASFPRLKSSPMSVFALRYAENGHVTLPNGGKGLFGKPDQGGTVFVFGTSKPHEQEKLYDVLRWKREGSGGDWRGSLLTAQNFDDGRCYQLGNGAPLAESRRKLFPNLLQEDDMGTEHELLCETVVQLPKDAVVGRPYTLYWVWQWPTESGKDPNNRDGRDEYYTSCIDIDVVSEVSRVSPSHLLAQQDPMPTSVPEFSSRTFLTADPLLKDH